MSKSKQPKDLRDEIERDVRKTLDDVAAALRGTAREVNEQLQNDGNLRRTLRDIGSAARSGADAVREGFLTAQPQTAREAKRRQKRKKKKDYAKMAKNAFGSAGWQLLSGGILGACAHAEMIDGSDATGAAILGLLTLWFLAWGVCSLCGGFALRRVCAYQRVLGDRSYCTVAELAAMNEKSERAVRRDLRRLIRLGKFEDVYLAPDGARLFSNETAYRLYAAQEAEREAARAAERQAQPQAEREAAPAQEQEEAPAAGPETLEDCRAFLRALREQQRHITDGALLEQTRRIEAQTQNILAWLERHPEGAGQIRRFASYYMPTTLKLLTTYNEVSPQAASSSVAAEIQENIRAILGTIQTAFQSLQNNLLKDTALDVSAEISALETVLAQDGLTRDGLSG